MSTFGGKRMAQFGGKSMNMVAQKRMRVSNDDDDDDDDDDKDDEEEEEEQEEEEEEVVEEEEEEEEEAAPAAAAAAAADDDDDEDDDDEGDFEDAPAADKKKEKPKSAMELEMERAEVYEREKEKTLRHKQKLKLQQKDADKKKETRSSSTRGKTMLSATERKKEDDRAAAREKFKERLEAKKQAEEEESESESSDDSDDFGAAISGKKKKKKVVKKAKPPPKKKATPVKKPVGKKGPVFESSSDDSSGESSASDDDDRGKRSDKKHGKKPVMKKRNDDSSGEDSEAYEKKEKVTLDKLNSIRIPRSLLEAWVEEPFFAEAVVGCFVRLGIGKAGPRAEPQYKVCEIIDVQQYKHPYALGEFETTNALLLKIGRSEKLWRMDVASNSRFTKREFEGWREQLGADRCRTLTMDEATRRKTKLKKVIMPAEKKDNPAAQQEDMRAIFDEAHCQKLITSRRKRVEAARFKERGAATVQRLNHGHEKQRYEHAACAARDDYAAALVALSRQLINSDDSASLDELHGLQTKIDARDSWRRTGEDFERELGQLSRTLMDARSRLATSEKPEPDDLRLKRKEHVSARSRYLDLVKNQIDARKKRDTEAPTRASSLAALNAAKNLENVSSDIKYGDQMALTRKQQSKDPTFNDEESSAYHRRPTRPGVLWSTKSTAVAQAETAAAAAALLVAEGAEPEAAASSSSSDDAPPAAAAAEDPEEEEEKEEEVVAASAPEGLFGVFDPLSTVLGGQPEPEPEPAPAPAPEPSENRRRNGMSLAEYLAKARKNQSDAS